jgi:peptidoglycan/LPS O-acetylase OafA/YrhL
MPEAGRGTAAAGADSREFRPEIEGLRAVAALLVMTYHLWFDRVSGGVDVFFVISGYLVTQSLLRQAERDGKLDVTGFWRRLVRRLAPASFLILFLAAIGCVLLLPMVRWADTAQQIVASALYVENWLLAFNAVDYLARDTPQSPVQHFWALSIQGQFYLFWPLLIAGMLAAARASGRQPRLLLGTVALAAFALSLGYSIIATATNQAWAYFDSFARFWEFCLGALLAIFVFRKVIPAKAAAILGWLALAAIIACGFVFSAADSFPGLAALWPTIAAAVILLVGTSGGSYGVHRLLASKPMVALGGVSYHLYLWHWLIMIFVVRVTWSGRPNDTQAPLIFLASLGLSFLTVAFLERPIRQKLVLSDRRLLATLAASIAIFVSFQVWVSQTLDAAAAAVTYDARDYPGAAVRIPGFDRAFRDDVPVFPSTFAGRYDGPRPDGYVCADRLTEGTDLGCRLGEKTNPRFTIAVVGASHVRQYMPVLVLLAEERGWQLLDFTMNGCHFAAGRSWASCEQRVAAITQRILAFKPDLVVTQANIRRNPEVPKGFEEIWRKMTDAGIGVLAIRDNPSFDFNGPECVEWYGSKSPLCSLPRSAAIDARTLEQVFGTRNDKVHFLDLSDYLCDAEICPAVLGNVLVFRDSNHLTATYARTLAPVFGARLDAILGTP